LTGAGIGLDAFLPEVRPHALSHTEKRFFVDIADVPLEIQLLSPGRSRRACVLEAGSSPSLEVHWGGSRKLLHLFLDQGSVGWPSKHFLFAHVGLRGSYWRDPCHRTHNNVLRSWHQTCINFVKLEVNFLINLTRGPFSSAAFFGTLHQASRQYLESCDHTDKLFQMLCPDIVRDQCGADELPLDFGTQAHMQAVWEALPQARVLNCKGGRSKFSRWFQFNQRAEQLKSDWSIMLLILIYIGLHEGWYHSYSDLFRDPVVAEPVESSSMDLPTSSSSAAPASSSGTLACRPKKGRPSKADREAARAKAAPAVVGQPPPERSTVKGSNAEMEGMRRDTRGSLHVGCRILANPATKKLMIMMVHVSLPIHQAHSEGIVFRKTQMGGMQWHIDAALGAWGGPLVAVLKALSDPAVLKDIGFERRSLYAKDAPEAREDLALANTFVELVRNTVANELECNAMYSLRPPGLFAGLLHPDRGVRETVLAKLERMWEAILCAERLALTDASMKQYVDSLMWPLETWCREVFIGLEEACFASVPPDLHTELQHTFRGFGSSKPAEDIFNKWTDASRQHKAGQLGPKAAWHRALTSTVMADADRQSVGMLPSASGIQATHLPTSLHKPNSTAPTLGEETMEKLTGKQDPAHECVRAVVSSNSVIQVRCASASCKHRA
jgi:hypothetical protein